MRAMPGWLLSASRTRWPRRRTACGWCHGGSIDAASCIGCSLPWSGTVHGARTTFTMLFSVPSGARSPVGLTANTARVLRIGIGLLRGARRARGDEPGQTVEGLHGEARILLALLGRGHLVTGQLLVLQLDLLGE